MIRGRIAAAAVVAPIALVAATSKDPNYIITPTGDKVHGKYGVIALPGLFAAVIGFALTVSNENMGPLPLALGFTLGGLWFVLWTLVGHVAMSKPKEPSKPRWTSEIHQGTKSRVNLSEFTKPSPEPAPAPAPEPVSVPRKTVSQPRTAPKPAWVPQTTGMHPALAEILSADCPDCHLRKCRTLSGVREVRFGTVKVHYSRVKAAIENNPALASEIEIR